MKTIIDLKNDIKALSEKQTATKQQRKRAYDGTRTLGQGEAAEEARRNKYVLRHMHIAYGLLRGRQYELIENRVRESDGGYINTPSWSYIDSLRKEYGDAQAVCAGA